MRSMSILLPNQWEYCVYNHTAFNSTRKTILFVRGIGATGGIGGEDAIDLGHLYLLQSLLVAALCFLGGAAQVGGQLQAQQEPSGNETNLLVEHLRILL